MPITINGTTGIAGVDGTASTPAMQGTDTNTGVYYGSDTVYISTGGTLRATVANTGLTLATQLSVANGGTGLTSLTAGYIPYGNGTGAFSSSSNFLYNGTQFFVGGASSSYIYLVNGGTNYGLLYADNSRIQLEALSSNPITFWTSSSEKMRLDAAGNLGLGVTPSAWALGGPALQIGSGNGAVMGGTNFYTGTNTFYSTNWKYISSNPATLYQQYNGTHNWQVAPSGAAGNAISFTQAMTLDASSNLSVVGTVTTKALSISDTSSALLRIAGGSKELLQFGPISGITSTQFGCGALDSALGSSVSFNSNGTTQFYYGTSGNEAARIDASGNLLVGDATNNLGAKAYVKGGPIVSNNGYDVGQFVGTSANTSIANGGTKVLVSTELCTCMVAIYDPGSGNGAVYIANYNNIYKVTGNGYTWATSDTAGAACLYVSGHTLTFKNNTGSSVNWKFSIFGAGTNR